MYPREVGSMYREVGSQVPYMAPGTLYGPRYPIWPRYGPDMAKYGQIMAKYGQIMAKYGRIWSNMVHGHARPGTAMPDPVRP